jgi:hypothetical protein
MLETLQAFGYRCVRASQTFQKLHNRSETDYERITEKDF